MEQKYKQLHFVTLQSLVNWSVAYLIKNSTLPSTFPTVSIGTFLKRNKTVIDVLDNVRYKRVTIKTMGGGVFLRDEQEGKNIGTKKQFIVKEGQFIVSKIDARNGAFGVVPTVANNAIITGNFWTFDVDLHYILPEYLALLTSTKEFMQFAEKASNGTTNRHYLQESLFLSQKIPLPSLEEQNKIIAAYNATIAQAKQYSTQAKDIDKQIEKYLNISLGIEESSVKKHESGKLYFMSSNQLTRWDVWNVSTNGYSKKYPLHYLHNVITMQSGKFLPSKAQKGGEYNVYGGNGLTGTHNEFCFTGKRIVIGRVGEYCGNVHLIDGNYWITDNALKVDKIADEVTWDFLAMALQALNINQYRSISAQPSISQTKILQLQIPIPPLHTQNEIVEHIIALRKKQKDLQQKSLTLRQQATQQFEQTIFSVI